MHAYVCVCFTLLNLLFQNYWNLEVSKLLANFNRQNKYIISVMCYENLLYPSMDGSYWQLENNIIPGLLICIYQQMICFYFLTQFVLAHRISLPLNTQFS